MIYLDHAAATPMDERVVAEMQPYFTDKFYNPSALYLASKAVKADLNHARASVAEVLAVRPSEIIFTAGGTEANNLAIFGATDGRSPGEIVTSMIEHESILEPLKKLEAAGWKINQTKPNADGIIEPSEVVSLISDKTTLVSIMYANNEIGTIEPIRHIAAEIQKIKQNRKREGINNPLYFHTDACQAANYLSLKAHNLGVDMMSLNGGKIYGPKQSGALFVSSTTDIKPLIYGGGQERGLRSGTENVAGAIGFATALQIAYTGREAEAKRLQALQAEFINLLGEQLPLAKINGSLKHRLPNNIHITIPGQDNERLMMALDEAGVQVGLGSACSASKDIPSLTLKAIGLTDAEARASLRLSMGRQTRLADLEKAVAVLTSVSS